MTPAVAMENSASESLETAGNVVPLQCRSSPEPSVVTHKPILPWNVDEAIVGMLVRDSGAGARRTALVELGVNGTAVQSRRPACPTWPPTRVAVPIADGQRGP
eukprot:CAMPEP_0205906294 /NCGR_PEP_ID=MMETSP1325-20131115/1864_1 /ASSEMBLY_ACC=CAM_ASM_000708 /TAXON_ID=236786 /ORGANISM="Florenciella sp., Strain RCC1007" /LENGTH=102 /DNA_ID=CAMNT_0053272293 /DNA_START=483 /DNA_END=787 /DNA_ORIENTATION=+